MVLVQLRLVNFRNHRRTDIAPASGTNLFIGANAQGKSALLEAVRLAAVGHSHRTPRDVELICLGESFARGAPDAKQKLMLLCTVTPQRWKQAEPPRRYA